MEGGEGCENVNETALSVKDCTRELGDEGIPLSALSRPVAVTRKHSFSTSWIMMPSRSPSSVVRQNVRCRVAPLKFWINERLLLNPVSGTPRVVSNHSQDLFNTKVCQRPKPSCNLECLMVTDTERSGNRETDGESRSAFRQTVAKSGEDEVQFCDNDSMDMNQVDILNSSHVLKRRGKMACSHPVSSRHVESCLLEMTDCTAEDSQNVVQKHGKTFDATVKLMDQNLSKTMHNRPELDILLTPLSERQQLSHVRPYRSVAADSLLASQPVELGKSLKNIFSTMPALGQPSHTTQKSTVHGEQSKQTLDTITSPESCVLSPEVARIRSLDSKVPPCRAKNRLLDCYVELDVIEKTMLKSDEGVEACLPSAQPYPSGNNASVGDGYEIDAILRSFWSEESDQDSCDLVAESGNWHVSGDCGVGSWLQKTAGKQKSLAIKHRLVRRTNKPKRNVFQNKASNTADTKKRQSRAASKKNKSSAKQHKGVLQSHSMTLRPRKQVEVSNAGQERSSDQLQSQQSKTSSKSRKAKNQSNKTQPKAKNKSKEPSRTAVTKVLPVAVTKKATRKSVGRYLRGMSSSMIGDERDGKCSQMARKCRPNRKCLVTSQKCMSNVSMQPPSKKQKLHKKATVADSVKPSKDSATVRCGGSTASAAIDEAITCVVSKQRKTTRTASSKVKQSVKKHVADKQKTVVRKLTTVPLTDGRQNTEVSAVKRVAEVGTEVDKASEQSCVCCAASLSSSVKKKETRVLKELNGKLQKIARKKHNASQPRDKAGAKWTKVKSSTVKKSSSSSEPTVTMLAQVTGKRGTMKRRRQLQQLIDFQQQQLDMDLFSSTPFRANKQITRPELMSELEECYPGLTSSDALAVSSCITPHGLGFIGKPNTPLTPFPLSTGNTPCSALMASVRRNDNEQYLYRLQKAHKAHAGKKARKNIVDTESRAFGASVQKLSLPATPADLFEMEPIPNNDDDESEMDDYFDDL